MNFPSGGRRSGFGFGFGFGIGIGVAGIAAIFGLAGAALRAGFDGAGETGADGFGVRLKSRR